MTTHGRVQQGDLGAEEDVGLPYMLCTSPEYGVEVRVGVGREGPCVVHNLQFVSLKAPDKVREVDLPRSLTLPKEEPSRRGDGSTCTVLKEAGARPKDGEPMRVQNRRYAPL